MAAFCKDFMLVLEHDRLSDSGLNNVASLHRLEPVDQDMTCIRKDIAC